MCLFISECVRADVTGGDGSDGIGGTWSVDGRTFVSKGSYSSIWRDPRVIVPAIVSATALLLTVATLCICIKKGH